MRPSVFTILIVLFAGTFLVSCAASAQYDVGSPYSQLKWSLHAGAAVFTGSDSKDTATWIVGIEGEEPFGSEGEMDAENGIRSVTLSADYIPVQTLAGNTASMVPLLVGYKQYGVIANSRVFFDINVGTRWTSDEIPELNISQGFGFGWGVGAGVNLTRNILGQIRYLAGTHPSDDGLVTFELGVRF